MSTHGNDIHEKANSSVLGSFFDYIQETTSSYPGCGLTNIFVRDDSGDSLLHYAIRFYDDPAVLAELIELGLDVNTLGDMDKTPLHVACACNNLDAVKVLVQFGARLDILSEFNRTPMDNARDCSDLRIYEYLQAHASNTNVRAS